MLKREDILSKTSLKNEVVTVEEWGGDVVVTEMSGSTRDAWEQSIRNKDEKGLLVSPRAKLIVFSVVDEAGNRIFNDDDIEAIGRLSSLSLEKVCAVSMRLNGLADGDVEKAKKN